MPYVVGHRRYSTLIHYKVAKLSVGSEAKAEGPEVNPANLLLSQRNEQRRRSTQQELPQ